MKNKKSVYILLSVAAVCLVGLAVSSIIDWPVDSDKAEGNIAKSSRFSRKTAEDGLSNMHELLLNDEDFKSSVVLSYVVMDTRSAEFSALVDMSAEAAGDIAEFKGVLKDMQKAKKTAQNVCASMKAAGEDLDAALGGEAPKDLAQNTTNAALAYNTLQKQNSLATRFVETADNYLENNEGDARLKFVRDQWAEYQQMTASLDGDLDAANAIKEKGYLLNAEQSASALGLFDSINQKIIVRSSALTDALGGLSSFTAVKVLRSSDIIGTEALANRALANEIRADGISNSELIADQALANQVNDALANDVKSALSSSQVIDNSELISDLALASQDRIKALNGYDIISTLGSFEQLDNLRMTTKELSLKSWTNVDSKMVEALPVSDVISAIAAGDAKAIKSFTLNFF